MRSFGRAPALIIAAALILTGIAPRACAAAPFTPQMNFAYELATAHWGGPPEDCISIDFEVVPEGSLGEHTLGEASDPEGHHVTCFLYMDRKEARPDFFEQMCAIMFHEDGHLRGFEHSEDPSNIMYPYISFIPPFCDKAGLWLMNHPKQKGGWSA